MATLANIFNQFAGARTLTGAAVDTMPLRSREGTRLRALPNEDVFFFVKRIDNARVVKLADPRSRSRDWKLIGSAGFAAIAFIGFLLPSAYGLMAGYQLSQLQREHQHLAIERTRLEMEEARLVSVERLQQLANIQQFVDPAPDRTVYLSRTDDSLALNRR